MKKIEVPHLGIFKYEYDRGQFPLAEIVAEMFSMPVDKLEDLHENLPEGFEAVRVADQLHVPQHGIFYGNVNPNGKNGFAQRQTSLGRHFLDVYDQMNRELIEAHLGEPSYWQVIPILRVQLPWNKAIEGSHRDAEPNGLGRHHPAEVNVFLPLSDAYGNNTIWAESEPAKKDFGPLEARVGELIVWDSSNLLHENRVNDSGKTRVSFDFRLWPKAKYVERQGVHSLILEIPMLVGVGGYFKG